VNRPPPPKQPDIAATSTFYTLSAVAKMLGEDEDWLWLISCGMEGEEGCIGVIGPNNGIRHDRPTCCRPA
jgi:hypothetical protein